MNLVKKISVKQVVGNVSAMLMAQEIQFGPLMRVVGVAGGVKKGTSDFGDYLGLKGQFKATNLVSGEEFTSGVCFLPDIASDLIGGAVQADDNASVEFAFEIGVKKDESAAIGYQYTAKPLMEMGGDDPLARIESNLKALDAPKDKGKK